MMKFLRYAAAAALVSLLAACGGGGGSNVSTNSSASSVRVFGDSLADSGAFGIRFTVNAAGPSGAATPIWPDLVAASYGRTVCNFFNTPDGGASFGAPTMACTNFAVGGGRINSLANTGGPSTPYSIPFQMDTAATIVGGTFSATELILVDGGGNDAADLLGAYLNLPRSGGVTTYTAMISTLVPAGSVTALIGTTGGPETLAGMYMTALGNKFADDINNKLLARSAKRVVVLNAPAVTNTPRFKAVLAGVAAASGGGATGAAAAAQVENLGKTWVSAFNTQLNTRLGAESRVAIVDFYTEFNNQVSMPSQFSLTNVVTPACPSTGTGSDGLPEYNFLTCTAANLNASGPATWRSYAFSDGFHPTPYGHQLLAQLVGRTLAIKGWL